MRRHLTFDEMGRTKDVIGSRNCTIHYQYDADGRQTQVATPQGVINYGYDFLGRMNRTWTDNTDARYSYDELGRVKTVTMTLRGNQSVAGPSVLWYGETIAGETTTYRYDKVGSLDLIKQANGVVSDYSYDPLNRLVDLIHFDDSDGDAVKDAAESVVARFQYELNADGNKKTATETDDQNITRHFRWTYDALDRLTSEVLDSSDDAQDYITTYTMDLVSNRLAKSTDNAATAQAIADFVTLGSMTADEVVEYEYDANDRMQWEKKDAAGTAEDTYTTYAWNAGDQVGKTTYAGLIDQGAVTETTTFEYNVQGRTGKITTVKAGQTTEITYTYNLQGIRVEEATTASGVTTTKSYLIDQANLIGYAQVLEEYVNGQLAKTFTLGHDVLTQADATNGPLTLIYDGHGSTRALLDPAAAVIQRYAYEAYGQMLAGQGLTALSAALTSLLYSGEMTDQLTGLQNLRDRLYDVRTGRFTQSDRYEGRNSDPASLHKYVYTDGNPVNGADPTGLMRMSEVMITASILGVLGGLIHGGIAGGFEQAKNEAFAGMVLGPLVALGVVGSSVAIAAGAPLVGVTISVNTAMLFPSAFLTGFFGAAAVDEYQTARSDRERAAAIFSLATVVAGAVWGGYSYRRMSAGSGTFRVESGYETPSRPEVRAGRALAEEYGWDVVWRQVQQGTDGPLETPDFRISWNNNGAPRSIELKTSTSGNFTTLKGQINGAQSDTVAVLVPRGKFTPQQIASLEGATFSSRNPSTNPKNRVIVIEEDAGQYRVIEDFVRRPE